MTAKSRATLNSDADTNLPNQSAGDISPADVRGAVKDLADSAVLSDDLINGTAKTTPVDADTLILSDSASSGALKKLSWANLKATLKTYFDTLYAAASSLTSHTSNTSNPHSVTAAQVGLGTSDSPQFTGIELGHASDTTLTRLSAGNVGVEGTVLLKGGKHTIQLWPGSFMLPDSGAPEYVKVSVTNQLPALAFDTSADESAWFAFRAPKSSDETAGFTFDYAWSHPSTTANFGVAMFLELVACGNSDLISTSMGTAVELDDTGGTTNDIFISDESGTVTPGGTWAEGDIIIGRLYRDVSDAFDNLAVDMRLHVFNLYVTLNAGNDA